LSEHLTQSQIEDYSRHNLTAAEVLSVSTHLLVCEACSRQVERALNGDVAFFTLKSEVFTETLSSPAGGAHLTLEQTTRYVDEALAGEELQVVTGHLADCEQCEMAVNDLRAFREHVAPELNREYQPSPVMVESSRRHFVKALPSLLPRLPALVFGSALTMLLLILAGWLIWKAPQWKKTEMVETTPSPTPPAAIPVVSPTPIPRDEPALVVARLNDGRGQVTLDQEGNLTGIDNLPPAYEQMIKGALTNQRLEKSRILAGLMPPGDPQIRSRNNPGREFSMIKPVGTVILLDRPTFRWSRLDGAPSYIVEVYDDKFAKVATSPQLIDNSWTASKSLPRGKTYTWQVKAVKDGRALISPPPAEPEAKFRILDRARAVELMQAQRTYARSHLTLGLLYVRDGLLDNAELEFRKLRKANPSSAIARRLLADVRAMRG
jgi:anti-sigma factor RsiW